MQVVQVYLQPFRHNSLLKCAPQPKMAKKSSILRVQVILGHQCLTPLESPPQVLVMISSMSVPICNCFYAKRANSDKITTF